MMLRLPTVQYGRFSAVADGHRNAACYDMPRHTYVLKRVPETPRSSCSEVLCCLVSDLLGHLRPRNE
eukprot:2291661-Heterocapsa_arctica.AAC.1